MASSTRPCLASMAHLCAGLGKTSSPTPVLLFGSRLLVPSVSMLPLVPSLGPFARKQPQPQARVQVRHAGGPRTLSEKEKLERRKRKAGRKAKKALTVPNLANFPKYSLCDAIRIFRAAEVGRPHLSVKYELAIRLKTFRDGPVIRGRFRLRHPCASADRIGVICPEGSDIAAEALAAGAVGAGEESIFAIIRSGKIPYTKLICHADSEPALQKASLGRILGPRGLMPNRKTNTVTRSVKSLITDVVGAIEFRERMGVVRMLIGQINFTPDQLSENIMAFMREIKMQARRINSQIPKEIHEVVLSTTNGPGLSLNGNFNPTDPQITKEQLESDM